MLSTRICSVETGVFKTWLCWEATRKNWDQDDAVFPHPSLLSSQSDIASVFAMLSTDLSTTSLHVQKRSFNLERYKLLYSSAMYSSHRASDNEVHNPINAGSFRGVGRICVHFTC